MSREEQRISLIDAAAAKTGRDVAVGSSGSIRSTLQLLNLVLPALQQFDSARSGVTWAADERGAEKEASRR